MDQPTIPAPAPSPWKSPTYPQRVHLNEAPQWAGVLAGWESRIAEARRQFQAAGSPADHARTFAQMLGARDQIAEAARRLPMVVGHFYHEDRQRLDEAVRALERLFAKWDKRG